MSTTISDSAQELLALMERESEAWPGQSRVELEDGDALTVTTTFTTDGVLALRNYRWIAPTGYIFAWSRDDALRCLEALIRREQDAAVVEAASLTGVL